MNKLPWQIKFLGLFLFTFSVICNLGSGSKVHATVNVGQFQSTSQSDYTKMPAEIPDKSTPGNSQYFVLSKTNQIDHYNNVRTGGGDPTLPYKYAKVVVYVRDLGNVDSTQLHLDTVSRAVNGNSTTNIPCNTSLNISINRPSYDSNLPVSSQTNSMNMGTVQKCQANTTSRGFFNRNYFSELTEPNPEGGAPIGRGVYYTYVTIGINDGAPFDQSSFRAGIWGEGRIGYAANWWNDLYGSKDYPTHQINVTWRGPCQANGLTAIARYDDGDTDKSPPVTQPSNGNVQWIRNGAAVGGAMGFTHAGQDASLAYTYKGSVSDTMILQFNNVGGGNGFGVNIPQDSGSYWLASCPTTTPTKTPSGTVYDCGHLDFSGRTAGKEYQFRYTKDAGKTYNYTATLNADNSGAGSVITGYDQVFGDGSYTVSLNLRVNNSYFNSKGVLVDDWEDLNAPSAVATKSVDCQNDNATVSGGANCKYVIAKINDSEAPSSYQSKFWAVIYNTDDHQQGHEIGYVEGYTNNDGSQSSDTYYSVDPAKVRTRSFDVAMAIKNPGPRGETEKDQFIGWYNTGNCFTASCTATVIGNIPNDNQNNRVVAGTRVKVSVTMTPDSSSAPLYDTLSGYQLTFSKGGTGDIDFGDSGFSDPKAIDFLGAGDTESISQIDPGSSVTQTFIITAPNDIGTHKVSGYSDYNGIFAIDSASGCEASFDTYQPYQIDPSANIKKTLPDTENPDSIEYTVGNTRKTGAYSSTTSWYGGTVASSTYSKLFYKPYGGSEAPGPFDQNTVANYNFGDFGDTANLANNDRLWQDTLPDTRTFNHGGVTSSWNIGDNYCPYFRVDNAFGWQGPSGPILTEARSASNCAGTVSNRPFVRIYGNDAIAGGEFSGSPIPATPKGGIYGYIRGDIAPAGAGVQFGAAAINAISGFSSASLRTDSPTPSAGLTFANSPSLGGGLDDRQAKDWFKDTIMPTTTQDSSVATNSFAVDSWTDGTQKWVKPPSGKVTLTGTASYSGRRTLYVDGDVVIKDNIQFNDTRSTVALIPSLVIIAKGNIYITGSNSSNVASANNVTRVDGMFIAQPKDTAPGTNNTAGTGIIYTCTRSDGTRYASTEVKTTCGSKLQVNGSLISQDTRFLRTAGTLKDVPVTQVSTHDTPGVPASNGIDNGCDSARGYCGTTPAGNRKCMKMVESSDPNWHIYGNTQDNDNYFCYNSSYTLVWHYAHDVLVDGLGSPAPATLPYCAYVNNPLEENNHHWGDNYICPPAGVKTLGLEMIWKNAATPVGKTCTEIYETDWHPPSETHPDAWTNGNAKLCYYPSSGGIPLIPGLPVKYQQETFGHDSAAESIRMTPESYLAQPVFQPPSQSNGKYDYIVTLPPVL